MSGRPADYKQILRLRSEGVSGRAIADVLGYSRNTVQAVLGAANTEQIAWADVAGLDGAEVRRRLLGDPVPREPGRARPDFAEICKQLTRPNVTLTLLWHEYTAKCRAEGTVPYRYSSFTSQCRRWAQVNAATMVIPREPGETIEVDWAGDTMRYQDPLTGEWREAFLFVAALPYSAYCYVEPCPDMTLGSWIDAHIHAFEHFGGTARILVPDNLRASVSKTDRYEPAINPAYAQMADHYGAAVIPARVRRPRDKATAEASVRFAANRIGAALRDRRFVGLAELADAVAEELAQVNAKPFQKREGSRLAVFERDERATLKPLPPFRFEMAELRKAKVAPNYHIQVLGNFYSVPSRLIGQTLDVRVTSRTLEAFDGAERAACHALVKGARGRYSTVAEHMPAKHRRQVGEWTPDRFESWAGEVGPNCRQAVHAILASHVVVEQSYRSCLGVMSLAKKAGGSPRLEEACRLALEAAPRPSYTLIRKIWSRLDPKAAPAPTPPGPLGGKGFVRGAAHYGPQGEAR